MRNWRRLFVGASVLIVVGVMAWFVFSPHEPVYEGKTLSHWLKDLEDWNGDTNYPAFVAFREMGTNAIPTLLSIIQSGGTAGQRMIQKLNQEQSLIELPYREPLHQSLAASIALYAMGSNAVTALPTLTNLLFHTNALFESTTAIAGMGPAG